MTEGNIIILAEDDPGHAELIEKNLRRAGVQNEIVVLKDGPAVLDYLDKSVRGSKATYFMLLDIKLPEVDGVEILRFMKSDSDFRDIPVCILTSSRDNSVIQECNKLGVVAFAIKPIDYEKFVLSVKELGLFILSVDKASHASEEELKQKEITLRNILEHIEGEKTAIHENVAINIERNILPIINSMKNAKNFDKNKIRVLENNLKDLSSDFYRNLVRHNVGLTPAEARVCKLIKEGFQDKEIARELSVSIMTVQSHRKNIRKKFNITNTPVNLKSFLDKITN